MAQNIQTLSEDQHALLHIIQDEYRKGFHALNDLSPYTITVYGGSRVREEDPIYSTIQETCKQLAQNGWSIVSGGGPGIMTASLEGANQGGGKAVSFTINIESEPVYQDTDTVIHFTQFSVRKYMLRQSDAFIVAPGGVGTFDEAMELITLMMTGKFPIKPIFFIGSDYWNGLLEWIHTTVITEHDLIHTSFWDIITVVDGIDQIKSKVMK